MPVNAATEQALRDAGLESLVIVADEGSQAARIYASVGFAAVERTVGLSWVAATADHGVPLA